jgi:monoamine oxidase
MEEMMEMQMVSTMVCNLVVLKGDSWVVVKANRTVANLVGMMVVLTVPLKVDGMVSLSAPQWVTLMDFAKVD